VISVPITAYLHDTEEGWVLFDAGLDEANLRDPERLEALYLSQRWNPSPVAWPAHEMEGQLRRIGLGFGNISRVVLSHLHADPSGHLKRMPQARLTILPTPSQFRADPFPDVCRCFPVRMCREAPGQAIAPATSS
jgi:N-acyl homoserine lactone hydrolase